MFRNSYQNGKAKYLELYDQSKHVSSSGKDFWRLRSVKKKVYEKSSKGYITAVDTNSASSMVLPKDGKKELAIILPFILFQVFIPAGKQISLEFVVTDTLGFKRRINFGKGTKTLVCNEHHSRIPSMSFRTSQWVNLCIDVKSFYEHCYPTQNFKQIDGITLTAFCQVRKIFAL